MSKKIVSRWTTMCFDIQAVNVEKKNCLLFAKCPINTKDETSIHHLWESGGADFQLVMGQIECTSLGDAWVWTWVLMVYCKSPVGSTDTSGPLVQRRSIDVR